MPFRHLSEDVLDLLSLLGDIGTRFLAAEDAETVAADVFNALSTRLNLGVYLNYLLAEDGRSLRLNSYAGIDAPAARSLAVLELAQAIGDDGSLGRAGVVAAKKDGGRRHDSLADRVRTLGVAAYACHPLLAGDRLIGALSFGSRSRERFTTVELELMHTVANFAAIAIDRANVTERHRRAQVLLARAQEDERRRLSHELHDEMAQRLAGLSLELQSLERLVMPSPAGMAKIVALQQLVGDLGRGVHRIALELRPAALDDLGLALALSNYVEEWSQRCGIPVDLHTNGLERRAPDAVETAVYRIVQEALTNVVKHACARRVSIVIRAADHHVHAVIEDDGVGFRVEDLSAGGASSQLGLAGMDERAALVGGTVTVESARGQGTSVYVRIPVLHRPAAEPGERTGRADLAG